MHDTTAWRILLDAVQHHSELVATDPDICTCEVETLAADLLDRARWLLDAAAARRTVEAVHDELRGELMLRQIVREVEL